MSNSHKENMKFEDSVRMIAEAVWHLPSGKCQPKHYTHSSEVHEIDGVAALRDVTHLIMITTSTSLRKVKEDVKKLGAAEKIEKKEAGFVRKWLITQYPLNAEHIEYAKNSDVVTLTREQFLRRFFDGARYLALRDRYAFGSARDPESDSIEIRENAYVPLSMKLIADSRGANNSPRAHMFTLKNIAKKINDGELVVMRAPFGSGKSLTTRELYKILADKHHSDSTSLIPLALNLREHWGEDYGDEILERHARTIGYTPREDVVVAWRAGMCCLLLDGYDELASQTVVRLDNRNFMREARRRALKGVREFTQKIPNGVGVFICGRDHYFDSIPELTSALGLTGKKYTIVDLEEFTEENANEFLLRNNVHKKLPDWIPRKPLILSYLVNKNLFDDILSIDPYKGFGYAWDNFLTSICAREAALESSLMDPETIRAVLEKLADAVRAKPSGTGPITGNDLAEAYSAETGQAPVEGVLAQLQRLPGLTQRDSEVGSRAFVDHDMLGALQGGAFCRHVLTGFTMATTKALSELSDRAISMATYLLIEKKTNINTILRIAIQLQKSPRTENVSQLVADCLAVAIQISIDTVGVDVPEVSFHNTIVEGACINRIPLDEIKLCNVTFRNCTIRELVLGEAGGAVGVSFENCIISKISGVAGLTDALKLIIGSDCEIEQFDSMATNSAVLQLDISPQLKALLTILRKLYKQPGVGRKLSAFSRGITRPDVLRYIDKVILLLERHQFLSIFNSVVHPVRKQSARVERILESLSLSDDLIVTEVQALE